ncbi:hypothetical protein [Allosalinactinospora lopnorensis]|uniref:hypothetical protein n=1 Tax=Allosalinactinospora lopnorensis TaxID=1352348 RepID=UPI000623D0D1|nr:hypothetical protein [Allosalinactinospora lopnorensis]
MAILLTAVACFISGLAAGCVFGSSYSAWSMRGVVNRQQRELIRLREEIAVLQGLLYAPPASRGGRLEGAP